MCTQGKEQGWTKEWTLGCVKFPPAARGGQGIHASLVLLSGPTLLQASPTSNLAYVIGHPVQLVAEVPGFKRRAESSIGIDRWQVPWDALIIVIGH